MKNSYGHSDAMLVDKIAQSEMNKSKTISDFIYVVKVFLNKKPLLDKDRVFGYGITLHSILGYLNGLLKINDIQEELTIDTLVDNINEQLKNLENSNVEYNQENLDFMISLVQLAIGGAFFTFENGKLLAIPVCIGGAYDHPESSKINIWDVKTFKNGEKYAPNKS